MEIDNMDDNRRHIGFRDEEDYGFRNEHENREGDYPERNHMGGGSGENMQRGYAGGGGMHEKWQRTMEKIRRHDKKHRMARTKSEIAEIIYDNIPGPNREQSELLVAIMEAIAMDCNKNKN